MISATSVLPDVTKAVSIDPKFAGDLVYIIGESKNEIGANEYINYQNKKTQSNAIGNSVPKVDAKAAIAIYEKFNQATDQRLIASALSPSLGGLGIALTKKAIAGQLGLELDLQKIPGATNFSRNDYLLFSESQSRFIVTVAPENQARFEALFQNTPHTLIGKVTENPMLKITGLQGRKIINTPIKSLEESYKSTFQNF